MKYVLRTEAGPIRSINSALEVAVLRFGALEVAALRYSELNFNHCYIRGTFSFWAGDFFPCGKDFGAWP